MDDERCMKITYKVAFQLLSLNNLKNPDSVGVKKIKVSSDQENSNLEFKRWVKLGTPSLVFNFKNPVAPLSVFFALQAFNSGLNQGPFIPKSVNITVNQKTCES